MKSKKRVKTIMCVLILLISVHIGREVEAETYEYDSLNRLTKVTYDTGEVFTYEYDANGNIKSVNNADRKESEADSDTGNTETNGGSGQSSGTTANQGQAGANGAQNPQTQEPNHPIEVITKKSVKTKKATYYIYFKGKKVSDVQLVTYRDNKAKSFTIPNTIK